MAGFSEKQEALVKESWMVMKEDIPALSLYLYKMILEIAPEARGLFSFLKDTTGLPQNNPKLKSHAVKVFKMVCEAAIQLREKGEVVILGSTLKYMGTVHVQKGIVDSQFEIIKEALIRTVEKAMGDKCSEEMKEAWSVAYDHLASAIKTEMKQVAASA
ncbi:non-symbiotic hemoglobin 2 [Tanacetum coccineum]